MKCSQENCERGAVASYVWPGRPERSYSCQVHHRKARAVAEAMGVCLGDEQLYFDDQTESEVVAQ